MKISPSFVVAIAFAGALLALAMPASADPITYSFAATVTGVKTNLTSLGQPVGASDNALWFPELSDGQTYAATGVINYDPTLIVPRGNGLFGPPMITLNLGPYAFTWGSSVGFAVGDGPGADSLSFLDCCLPAVVGPMPPSPPFFFVGRDASLHLADPTGTALAGSGIPVNLDGFPGGTLSYFGEGATPQAGGGFTSTGFGFVGSVDSIQRVPEPGILSLLCAGGAVLAAARRKRKTVTRDTAQ
jgi:hypothetical protein